MLDDRGARIVFAAVAQSLTAGAAARRRRRRSRSSPTFKAQVEYVEVDALVTDQQGNFVRDLTKDDFQVLEDGKPRRSRPSRWSTSRSSAPIARCSPRSRSSPTCKTNERPFDGRVYVMMLDDLHTRVRPLRSASKIAAQQFIERNLGANDLMAVVHTGGRARRQPGVHQQQAAAAGGGRQDSWGRSSSRRRAQQRPEYYRTRDIRQPGDPLERSGRHGARLQRAQHARHAQERRRVVRRRPRPPQVDALRQRRHRLRHQRHDSATPDRTISARRRSSTTTRDAIAAATRSNVSIYAIDPRGLTDLGDETIESRQSLPTDDHVARHRAELAAERAAAVAGQPAHALRRDRRVRRRSTGTTSPTPSSASSRDNSSYYVLAYYPPVRQARRQVPQDRSAA